VGLNTGELTGATKRRSLVHNEPTVTKEMSHLIWQLTFYCLQNVNKTFIYAIVCVLFRSMGALASVIVLKGA
jgi:hypothetical protein